MNLPGETEAGSFRNRYGLLLRRLPGRHHSNLVEWKTTSCRDSEEPRELLSLEPQLVCYSWITGISDVAEVVFVRKRLVEIQYLRAVITNEQREEFGRLVEDTIQRIESAHFLAHSGIRFPHGACTSCPYTRFCLRRQDIIDVTLIDWLDELNY